MKKLKSTESAIFILALMMLVSGCATEEQLSLCSSGNGVTDIDGNQYSTFVLGNREWMAENLRTSSYSNGDAITNEPDINLYYQLTSEAWCWYGNDGQNDTPHGKLYNWHVVNDSRGVCPIGWHVPTDSEWLTLITSIDPNTDVNAGFTISEVAGGKMKTTGSEWLSPNDGATNESCFTAYPSGIRGYEDQWMGGYGLWWTATDAGDDKSWRYNVTYTDANVNRSAIHHSNGISIRCIKD